MADTIGQSGKLPSIRSLDMEKIKRETMYNQNVPVASALAMSAPPLISPSTLYSGPPPPYSYPSSAASSVIGSQTSANTGAHGTYISPPTTRSASGDEKEQSATQRQSLPSITEALSGEQQPLSISSLLSSTGPPQKSSLTSRSPTSPTAARSCLENLRRGPLDSFPHHTSNPTHQPADRTSRPMYSPQLPTSHLDNRFPTLNSFTAANAHDIHSAVQPPRTVSSPSSYSRPGASPVQHSRASPPRETVGFPAPPASSAPFGFSAPYQPAFSYPPTTPGLSSYRPPAASQEPAWRNHATSIIERDEELKKAYTNHKYTSPPRQAYGESVKRHLDIFDLESSLNEIADGSGHTLHWSRQYRINAHQTQRSGPIPGSLPSLDECDEMIREQEKTLQAMARIRSVIFKQQQALQEQRNIDKLNYKVPSRDTDDDNNSFSEKFDGAGGFAGSDPKKRRGRAAPPGRCHSCNRAETPEWRRGPDGARTLCNACGLHYAKLTRKMGSKAPNGPSNLRPKESSPASP